VAHLKVCLQSDLRFATSKTIYFYLLFRGFQKKRSKGERQGTCFSEGGSKLECILQPESFDGGHCPCGQPRAGCTIGH
jgi:hypothetical protein